jgi:ABC-type uncharacterized transport system permease subunit
VFDSILNIVPPLLIAACAGYFPYRSGLLNIGLEGLMALGAFSGFLAAALSGCWWVGIAAGALTSGLSAALFARVVQSLDSNIFLSGLGLNLASAGGLGIVSQIVFGTKGVLRPSVAGQLPFPADPRLLPLFLAGAAFLFLTVSLRRTRWGHRIIAAGEAPQTLENLGISVANIRFQALVLSGIGCGAAGALLSLDIGAYVPNMTGGRGWIALVALYIAASRPPGLLWTVLLFSIASAAATSLQGLTGIPDSLLLASPFLFTFLGLLAASGARTFMASKRRGRAVRTD